jgi:hypothetical protein
MFTAVALVAAPTLAAAEEAPGADAAAENPEAPSLDPDGTDENPDGAVLPGASGDAGKAAPTTTDGPAIDATGYPVEEILRPITLPEFKSELQVRTGFTFNPEVNNSVLRGRFGVTRQFQLGLTYNIGGLYDDDGAGPKKTTFNPGKSIGVDATVLVMDWVAVQVGVPVYLDPVAVGLTLGAPMKFRLTKNFAVGGLHDLVDIKLKGFVPSLDNEGANEVNAALVDTNSITDDGNIRIQGYGTYQHTPTLAITGEFGVRLADFAGDDAAYPLRFTAQYSPANAFDVAGTLGFENLDEASHSFGVFVAARLRL